MYGSQFLIDGGNVPNKPRKVPRNVFIELKDGTQYSKSELRTSDPEVQTEVMKDWFLANFEDPAENTPYESAEGGFQFIWGGPYDPEEQLSDRFSGVVPDEVISDLATELCQIAPEWTGHIGSTELDEYVWSVPDVSHFGAFTTSIKNVKKLLTLKVPSDEKQCFLRLLYAQTITILEAYLSNTFITSIKKDPKLLRRFVETEPDFKNRKLTLNEVFSASEKIEEDVKKHLAELVWHRLEKVKLMFRDTLGIYFPDDLTKIFKAIETRHDIVHRNGATKDGTEHNLTVGEIEELIQLVEWLVANVEAHNF